MGIKRGSGVNKRKNCPIFY